ncbi:unnamed protein product [Linum tenue]|uniref:CCHC-type domain-containing protein n=1 Tax=Linum tenue TaxID=586396 RepID=A0AAV0PEG3_9ROSI|nr:unnamed protein product [Linum tenue]
MIVWVQLPAFPVHYYHREVLFSLGNMIGRTIKLDYHTLHQQRARFARIAVEIDLSKPLVTRIRLDGQWQYLEYENLPEVCFECGKIGHSESSCPKLMAPSPPLAMVEFGSTPEMAPATQPEEKVGYGPWMQVSRRSRRGNRNTEKGNSETMNGASANQGKAEKGKGDNKEILTGNLTAQGRRVGINQRAASSSGGVIGRDRSGSGKGKGKEILEAETEAAAGKGVLGPGPQSTSNKNNPSAFKARAQSKDQAGSGQILMNKGADIALRAGPVLASLSPPSLTDIAGPSGTSIQIVNFPTVKEDENRNAEALPTSAGQRTKKAKKKLKSPKKSPLPVTPKALQIWTPVKGKKNKARTKLAALTLQEIDAWTGAAKANASSDMHFRAAAEPEVRLGDGDVDPDPLKANS